MALLDNIDPSKVKKSNQWHRWEDASIFRPGLNTIINLNHFHMEFSYPGIDLYHMGRNTVINQHIAKRLQREL